MLSTKKPYLIIPTLIEQPTWGGKYILTYKNWNKIPYLKNKLIGQSYELFGQSKLLINLTDSSNPAFVPEVMRSNLKPLPDCPFPFEQNKDYVMLSDLVKKNPMPLLIKFTQASGNSFQLHVKQSVRRSRWKPKAESWYYFEDGFLTYGINKNTNVADYKKACQLIEAKMKAFSHEVKNGNISSNTAKKEAKEFIQNINPWQYVNLHYVKKNTLIDLSGGGIHHSWEENKEKYPLGNVLYEIQQDVTDSESTLRSFDQGKIGSNGEIRSITIDDYFTYLDTEPAHNDIQNALLTQKGSRLLSTPYYSLDVLEVKNKMIDETDQSFVHLFVREGEAVIETEEGQIRLTKGHSCFIPQGTGKYTIKTNNALLLKTYIE